MSKVSSKFVILFAAITLLDATKQECLKSCNDNGFCYVENGIEKCNCLDRIYAGESCDELVNHCDENPCKNGGKCIPEEGQYVCMCTENFYGQNCTFTDELFGQIYLQYNHIAPVSSNDNHFLIILTALGSVKSRVEMVTSGYAIAGDLSFPFDSVDFVQTNDIRAIATKFNVSVSPSIPTGTVFYHAGKYRMSTPGIAIVTLTVTDSSGSSLFYKWDFQFGSMKNVGCNPVIGIRNCGGPRDPVSLNVKQSVFVEANIQRDCGRDSNISHRWSISNYFDTKTLQSFNVGSRSLKIPPFSILTSYNWEDGFSRFNVIKLVTLESSADGTQCGEAVNRCYIFIINDDPIAKIAGGEHQEYSNKQQILMDASDSVDMSVHPRRNQNLTYSWRCSSNDADEYCKNLNGIGTFATTPLLPYISLVFRQPLNQF